MYNKTLNEKPEGRVSLIRPKIWWKALFFYASNFSLTQRYVY